MAQEQKELLLKDLCARLPYGVKLYHISTNDISILEIIGKDFIDGNIHDIIGNFKPYLFPPSSMTKEQFQELNSLNLNNCAHSYEIPFKFHNIETFSLPVLEWFLEHHFDVNGLLEKGLAINATGKNIY